MSRLNQSGTWQFQVIPKNGPSETGIVSIHHDLGSNGEVDIYLPDRSWRHLVGKQVEIHLDPFFTSVSLQLPSADSVNFFMQEQENLFRSLPIRFVPANKQYKQIKQQHAQQVVRSWVTAFARARLMMESLGIKKTQDLVNYLQHTQPLLDVSTLSQERVVHTAFAYLLRDYLDWSSPALRPIGDNLIQQFFRPDTTSSTGIFVPVPQFIPNSLMPIIQDVLRDDLRIQWKPSYGRFLVIGDSLEALPISVQSYINRTADPKFQNPQYSWRFELTVALQPPITTNWVELMDYPLEPYPVPVLRYLLRQEPNRPVEFGLLIRKNGSIAFEPLPIPKLEWDIPCDGREVPLWVPIPDAETIELMMATQISARDYFHYTTMCPYGYPVTIQLNHPMEVLYTLDRLATLLTANLNLYDLYTGDWTNPVKHIHPWQLTNLILQLVVQTNPPSTLNELVYRILYINQQLLDPMSLPWRFVTMGGYRDVLAGMWDVITRVGDNNKQLWTTVPSRSHTSFQNYLNERIAIWLGAAEGGLPETEDRQLVGLEPNTPYQEDANGAILPMRTSHLG